MLMNWSSPFPEEPTKQKPKQKITSSKQLDTEEDNLANYTPPKPKEENVYEAVEYTYKSKDSELMEKLNYMIYLLEEHRDEKTGQVTEELILYVFLGIFTLFVLDTFVKNGKYSR
jgi:hypothetical protein